MTDQINILEKLNEKFKELKNDIQYISDEIEENYKTNTEFENELNVLKNKQLDLLKIIQEKEAKKERLEQILNTTEENFNQVQQAAQSLLDIMAAKNDNQ